MFSLSVIVTFVASWSAALAAPSQSGARGVLEVIDPKILMPDASTVWMVGSTVQVTWDTSDLPPLTNITNVIGTVILGQYNGNGEKLDFDHPLADGFLLTDGHVGFTVPVVSDGNYMVVLLGDSGNSSPEFRIMNNLLSSTTDHTSSTVSLSSKPPASASSSSSTPSSTSGAETSPSTPLSSVFSSTAGSPTTSASSSQSSFSAPFTLSNSSSPTSTPPPSPTSQSQTTSQPPSPTVDSNSGAANGALPTLNVPMCMGLTVFASMLAL